MREPATYPEITIRTGDLPLSWKLTIKSGNPAAPVNLSNSVMSAAVWKGRNQVATLQLGRTSDALGVIFITLDEITASSFGSPVTWALREETLYNMTLVRGTIRKVDP